MGPRTVTPRTRGIFFVVEMGKTAVDTVVYHEENACEYVLKCFAAIEAFHVDQIAWEKEFVPKCAWSLATWNDNPPRAVVFLRHAIKFDLMPHRDAKISFTNLYEYGIPQMRRQRRPPALPTPVWKLEKTGKKNGKN